MLLVPYTPPSEPVVKPLTGQYDFTGKVGMSRLIDIDEGSRVRTAIVRFEPCARTLWHHHVGQQILYVVSGKGMAQTWEDCLRKKEPDVIAPGDVVYFSPGEKHWHGATPDSPLEQIAFITGGETIWNEEVSEEQYFLAKS